MNKAIKSKWLEALRSGRYRQSRNALFSDRGYCCLGVLARITSPKAKRCSLEYPPDTLVSQYQQTELANLNDGFGGQTPHDFKQIADYIEANL
jgi:hypothetical protein